ncbi:MAG: neuraminidase-like domain-containing protein [Pyrinomonadaceae bacterium]
MPNPITPELEKRLDLFKQDFRGKAALAKTFEKVFTDKKGDWEKIERSLKRNAAFSDAVIENLKFTHDVAEWSEDSRPLVTLFQTDKKIGSMRDIALTYNRKDLKKAVGPGAVPKGETKTDYTDKLFDRLFEQEPTAVIVNMITDPKVPLLNDNTGKFIGTLLQRDKFKNFNIREESVYKLIAQDDELKDFDPEKRTKKDDDFKKKYNVGRADVIRDLKSLQRITSVSPVPEAVPALTRKGFGTAYQITESPLSHFLEQMKNTGLAEETLKWTYANAENKNIFVENALIAIKEAGMKTGIAMIDNGLYRKEKNEPIPSDDNVSKEVKEKLRKNNLSWELLFGESSYCECGECTSVYSAASYFVDLLQFLRSHKPNPNWLPANPRDISGTVLKALFDRRPDLGNLELSCENTNTILPYVDLVNEVLEQYVAFKALKAFNVGEETSQELLAAPQHTEETRAYQQLAGSVYPFDLPYDRPRDMARVYLKSLETTRYEVMTTFRASRADSKNSRWDFVLEPSSNGGNLTRTKIEYRGREAEQAAQRERLSGLHRGLVERAADAEYLKMSPLEYSLITNESFVSKEYWDEQLLLTSGGRRSTATQYLEKLELPRLESCYGYQTIADLLSRDSRRKDGLCFVGDQFLPRTGLKIADLIELLKTRYVNSDDSISLPTTCLVEEMTIDFKQPAVARERYEKMHRFIRLWRKTGWAMHEVDEFIASVGAGNITAHLISQIVAAKKVAEITGLEIAKLLCFWGSISTYGDRTAEKRTYISLYERLFLSPALRPDNSVFNPDTAGNYLTTANQTIARNEPVIMAALNLSSADIGLIKNHAGLDDRLSLSNISALYRHRLLSKTLGVRIPQLMDFLKKYDAEFAASDGTAFGNAGSTLKFLERWEAIEDSGFSSVQLSYALKGADAANPLAATETEAAGLTRKLYDGLTLIRDAHKGLTDTSEATSELVRSLLVEWLKADKIDQVMGLLEGTTVSGGTAPRGLTIQDPTGTLKNKFSYDAGGKIRITGALTSAELTEAAGLLDTSAAEYNDWKADIHALSDRITQERETVFNLFPNETLFDDVSDAKAVLVDPASGKTQIERKRAYVCSAILVYPRKELSNGFIIGTLAEAVLLDVEMTRFLAGEVVRVTDNNGVAKTPVEAIVTLRQPGPAGDYPVRKVLNAYKKLALLAGTFELSLEEIKYFHTHRADFAGLDLNALSLGQWLRLNAYVGLRNSLAVPPDSIIKFWKWLGKGVRDAELRKKLAVLFNASEARIKRLIAPEMFNLTSADFVAEQNLVRINAALEIAEKIGLDIGLLFECALPNPSFADCAKSSENLRNAIRAKYSAADWNEAVKPLNDELRRNGRNALVSYILQQDALKRAGVRDADGLFEYFLIDVQMQPCMETSRIKQAISSVQLFVQRCLLGLEEERNLIKPSLIERKRWDWMQRYRVWEANRKVFLYPENWIESNLRDDKSAFFKEMESELLQKDINKENIEDALKAYLYKVDEVSNMEVVGLYIEGARINNVWSSNAKLHVFSRTRNAPYFFYYRYLAINEANWYPWEKIQVDIPSYDAEDEVKILRVGTTYKLNPNYKMLKGSGCYLSPIIFNGRLMVFFPQFARKTKPNDDAAGKSIKDMAEDSVETAKPIEYWEIKMAWSEYRNGKWTPKQLSKDALVDIPPVTQFERDFDIAASLMVKKDLAQRDYDMKYRVAWKRRTNWDQKRLAADAQTLVAAALGSRLTHPAAWKAVDDLVAERDRLWDIYKKAWDREIDAKDILDDITPVYLSAIAALQGRTPPQPSSDISNYEFVPLKLTGVDSELRLEVYYDQREVGAFGFDGSNLTAKLPNGSRQNWGNVDYFHHSSHSIRSLQKPAPVNPGNLFSDSYVFRDESLTTYNTSTNFCHKDAKKLLGIINSGQMDSVFGYPNVAGNITDKNDVFGGNGLTIGNNTYFINYHELKRPYSLYNWELFFHCPTMLADAQSKAQRFEDAMKWFHYVFNPLAEGTGDKRFWQFSPFRDIDSKNILERIFSGNNTAAAQQIDEWRKNPFMPHVIARSRPVAYMKWVVMKYIDNLLDWGDYLFRQDTIESINQATQLYVLALHILGPKPDVVPGRGKAKTQTYNSLLAKWDAFSNARSEFEVARPFVPQAANPASTGNAAAAPGGNSIEELYFCIPSNPKLLGYWDTLADRLFKIRHCQNIQGVVRKLPLFEPPIDPALLVDAAANGVNIDSVLDDLNTPMPNYRFYYLLQKALELCGELKSMGGAVLSAIEKKDNEAITLVRAKHESSLHNLVMEIKKHQLEEAAKSLEGLEQNRKSPEHRMNYYLQLVGEDGGKIPGLDSEFAELANSIEKPIDESGLKLIKYEKEDMDKANLAADLQFLSGMPEVLAGILFAIPMLAGDVKPFGIGAGASFGGTNLGHLTQTVSKALQISATHLSHQSARAGKKGGFLRALQDRIMQANAAGYEIKQIDKQIVSQKIRIAIANQEITNQQKQIDNANEIEEFLKNKYSDEELYTWMRGSLRTLYRQVYNLAFDLAKKAEKTYAFERGVSAPNFIRGGYFDAGRDGLLAGEQLYVALKQLEATHQENRGYDYEITKHISISQLDPLSIVKLRQTGKCEFEIPEALFDIDFPGHYCRRIKSVSLSIPCVAGPYTGVNATLRLTANKLRNKAVPPSPYPEKLGETDDRFNSYNVPIASIATSSGQNDSGVFELNFKDERYLPFEGAGAISQWSLELSEISQFDRNTISDVILHLKYTSKEGGGALKTAATNSVKSQLAAIKQELNETGLHVAINLKHDLPNEWHLLKTQGKVDLKLDKSRAPYFALALMKRIDEVIWIEKVIFLAKPNKGTPLIKINNANLPLTKEPVMALYNSETNLITLDIPFKLESPTASDLEDLVMVVKFGFRH